jgi:hypothetical protein
MATLHMLCPLSSMHGPQHALATTSWVFSLYGRYDAGKEFRIRILPYTDSELVSNLPGSQSPPPYLHASAASITE